MSSIYYGADDFAELPSLPDNLIQTYLDNLSMMQREHPGEYVAISEVGILSYSPNDDDLIDKYYLKGKPPVLI